MRRSTRSARHMTPRLPKAKVKSVLIMEKTIATARANQLEALWRANWFYRIAAFLGPLVLAGTLSELARNEPNALLHVFVALTITISGVGRYFGTKEETCQIQATWRNEKA